MIVEWKPDEIRQKNLHEICYLNNSKVKISQVDNRKKDDMKRKYQIGRKLYQDRILSANTSAMLKDPYAASNEYS